MWKYSVIFLFLLHWDDMRTAGTQCCPGNERVTSNLTCTDGTDPQGLSCNVVSVQRSSLKHPLLLEVNEKSVLSITYDEDVGRLEVQPNKYCLGVENENKTTIILLCIEDDIDDTENFDVGVRVLSYIRMVCALVSTVFFFGIVVIYICMSELRDIEGKCIINFSFSCGVSHLLQVIAPIIIFNYGSTCDAFSFINNFSILCAFNWLTVMSVHIWRMIIRPIFRTQMNWFVIYVLYGYGLPIILLITSVISHLSKQKDFIVELENYECWLEGSVIVWFYFYGPIAMLVFTSTVFQLWAAKKLWYDTDKRDQSSSVLRLRKKCKMYLHVLLVAGTMVILELSMYPLANSNDVTVRYINTIMDCRNLLIGGVTFYIFIVLRNKVLRALAKNGLCCFEFPSKWKKLIDEEEEIERETDTEETTLTRYSA
ncbi:hypothetical protein FQA39_LY08048 [Lamprigera yunnana]|nr:hypothetical protein FQA39_LY08048 [Lamprigera yunnana]